MGTRKAYDLSGNPYSPLYKELMDRIAGQPTYTFRVIERKKSEGKKTYEGLTFNLMIDYLDAVSEELEFNDPEKSKEAEELRNSLDRMKKDGIPFGRRKKIFLEKYVSALTESVPFETIRHFGMQSSRDVDKFANFTAAKRSHNGINYITEHTNTMFSCKVLHKKNLGSHMLFVGEVTESKGLDKEPSCAYACCHKENRPKG